MMKVILFDFAGVLTTEKCFPAVAKKLSTRCGIDKELIQRSLYSHEGKYILGNESSLKFWERSIKRLGVPYNEFKSIFSSWYVLNEQILKIIKKLKKNYRVVLLSDNFTLVTKVIKKDRRLNILFEKMYFSNELHLSKKDKRIFEFVIKRMHVRPSECLFIDDKERNLVPAKKIGINVLLFQDSNQFKRELASLGISLN